VVLLPAASVDDIPPLVDVLQELGDFPRGVLEVVVHGHGNVVPSMSQTTEGGVVLAEVPAQIDTAHSLVEVGKPLDFFPAVVLAAVIDEENLKPSSLLLQYTSHSIDELAQRLIAVENRNDHGDARLKRRHTIHST
jgi:hypothetical protein